MSSAWRSTVNVVLDVLAKRESHYAQSAAVWAAVEADRVQGAIAAHTVTTVHYLLTRFADRATASTAVQDLLRVFEVAAVDGDVLQEALGFGWRDFEDAVQITAALSAGATHMITRNPPDFRGAPIPVLTPAEIVPLLPR